ncbi:TPA: recombinase family protein [Bacillus cereus]|uniref:recombinase family protein n=1 Tax=Bacillus TaxID=1386 RepID=UPI001C2FCA49|nr:MULTISPECIES: recombinase family protein [unclassified Bacillus (in: firmicutes)]MCP1284361.1 recombinase family protein [Bacillus sp. S0635]MCQ6349884.1 recombinase family protein [Bacillus cereus]HDX9630141.1 recombinase family protein [Bacillus cereus]
MAYAVYVRVSSDKDEQVSSVENQIDICRYWLENNGFEWDEHAVYFDDGISGTAWLERHAMQRILNKARKKELDTVIFKSIHRLARDLKDALEIKEILLGHGVRLITIEEGYDSHYEGKNDMKFEMYAMFASQLPKTLSVSVTAALAAKVRRGGYTGGFVPYGYEIVDDKYAIHDEEAALVREIFELYSQGFGYIKIANTINDKGARTRKGAPWTFSTLCKMIKNPAYKGTYTMQKYGTVKVNGRKKKVINPKEKWVIFENHHPAIINHELWDMVNDKDPNKFKKKRRVSTSNELRGITVCAHCGTAMSKRNSINVSKNGKATEYSYMICNWSRTTARRECVKHVPIHYKDLRALVLDKLKEKESVLEKEFYSDENRLHVKLKKLNKDIKDLKVKKERLLDLYLEGERIDKDTFTVRNKKLEKEIELKELEIQKANNIETQMKEKQEVRDAFALLEESKDLNSVFKKLIKRIEVAQDGAIDIHYRFAE